MPYGRAHATDVSVFLVLSLCTECNKRVGANVLTLTDSIQFLRDVQTCFGTTFKVTPVESDDASGPELIFACLGIGYVNANRSLA